MGILNTSKYPGVTLIQLPPPWKGPSVSGRPVITNGRPNPPCNGTQHVAAALTTPGTTLRRSAPLRIIRSTACDDAYCGPVIDIRIVSTLLASNPGSTRPSAIAERISSADPISNVSASATSVTTRIERVLFWRNPVPDRPPVSFNVVVRSVFDDWIAGINPNINPVASDTAVVNPSTRQSMPTSTPSWPMRGRPAVLIDNIARMASTPNNRPSAPPITDNTMLSVSTWLMMRPRDPPSAARMAISRLRPVARTSRRLATFAHAISSTNPTAPISTNSD